MATPTSSLNPPQSQVSAPVHEFRCMFTHDIFKKQKKWHDGSVKFHTFNKRVMVYDESRNFVGDLHYRGPEEFEEGLEFKLDRPVLVEVGDRLGQTDTDLTQLLGRQKQDGAVTQANSQLNRSTLSRINTSKPLVKPKSIRELLGASQGRFGRSRLPLQSPYEQRQISGGLQPDPEPVPKRRKVGEETLTKQRHHHEEIPLQIVSRSVSKPLSRTEHERPKEVVELFSDDEPSLNHEPRTLAGTKPKDITTAAHKQTNKLKQGTRANISKDATTFERLSRPFSREHENASMRPSSDSSDSRPPTATSRRSQRFTSSGPRSSLKLPSQKPRLKLMYKALLSAIPVGTDNIGLPASARVPEQAQQAETQAPQFRRPRNDLLDTDRFFALSQMQPLESGIPLPRSQDRVSLQRDDVQDHTLPLSPRTLPGQVEPGPAKVQEAEICVPTSPLFMTQTASQSSALPMQGPMLDALDLDLDAMSMHRDSVGVSSSQPVADEPEPDEMHSPELQVRLDLSSSSPSYTPTHRTRSGTVTPKVDVHLQPSIEDGPSDARKIQDPQPEPPIQADVRRLKRPFRRVVSLDQPALEHNKVNHHDGFQIDLSSTDTSMRASNLLSPDPYPAQGPPALLRTSTSDPSAFLNIPTIFEPTECISNGADPLEQQKKEQTTVDTPNQAPEAVSEPLIPASMPSESGAWTSTEAFLLFDRWPLGRQKPDYGQMADEPQSRGLSGGLPEDERRVHTKSGITAMTKKYGTFGSAKLVSQQ
ncbi:hypothetical protein LTS08_007371 [Lithohypha guttulata]|nr:hypothetical protein LTS08_007371 [Lithohypha guttulata]